MDIVLDSSAGVVLHGSAQALMSMDECFLLPVGYNANVMQTRNGGANAQVLMPANAQVDGSIVNGDMARNMVEQAANANGGDPNNQPKTESPAILNSLLDSSTADAIITFRVAPSICRTHHYLPCTLPLNSTFDYRHFTFLSSVPPFSALILSRSSSPDLVLCFHATFSPQFFLVAQFLFLFHLYNCMILQLSPLYISRFLLCQLQFIHPQLIISTLFPYILIWNHRGYLQSLYTLAHPCTSRFLPVVFLYHSTLFFHHDIPLFLIPSYD